MGSPDARLAWEITTGDSFTIWQSIWAGRRRSEAFKNFTGLCNTCSRPFLIDYHSNNTHHCVLKNRVVFKLITLLNTTTFTIQWTYKWKFQNFNLPEFSRSVLTCIVGEAWVAMGHYSCMHGNKSCGGSRLIKEMQFCSENQLANIHNLLGKYVEYEQKTLEVLFEQF